MRVIFDGDTVTITERALPRWEVLVPYLLIVYERGNEQAKENVRRALVRMAQQADKLNNKQYDD